MWYLVFPPDSSLAISFGIRFIAFSSYKGAEEYRKVHKVNAFLVDTDPGKMFIFD